MMCLWTLMSETGVSHPRTPVGYFSTDEAGEGVGC